MGQKSEKKMLLKKNLKISDIYDIFVASQNCYNMLCDNKLDIEWLKENMSREEYCKLENHIMDYSSKNDEILFKAGFQYAWSLFLECMEKEEFNNR